MEILRGNGFKISIILKQIKNFLENKYQNKSQITYCPSKQNIFYKTAIPRKRILYHKEKITTSDKELLSTNKTQCDFYQQF